MPTSLSTSQVSGPLAPSAAVLPVSAGTLGRSAPHVLSPAADGPDPVSGPLSAAVPDVPPPPPPVSPFTGLPTDRNAPVLGVKIDNAAVARPQRGLEQADLVYMEPVEGGLSRLLAVYQSQVPPVVGPVRSTRAPPTCTAWMKR